ncbi:MAG: LysR family transcriptional regulator [Clostridiales bacterium]|nr:LysR family transcriptional regulator [Clostridiales bacterium]
MAELNTQQLETFIQVADNLNFARAAEVLSMTQSAVSRQIHSLEDELGTQLLIRTTRTVTLTPAGISFLEDAKKIINTLNTAKAKINQNTEANIQVLTMGCGNEVDLDFLYLILKELKIKLPEIHPFLKIIPHRSILSLFSQGDIDILFGFRDDIPLRDNMVYKELVQIPPCCAISDSHFFAGKESVSISELYSESIILCKAVPSRTEAIQEQIASHILPEKTYICENLQAALALIRAGYGFTIVPKIEFPNAGIRFISLKDAEILSYGMFYKKNSMTPTIKKAIDIIRKISNQ